MLFSLNVVDKRSKSGEILGHWLKMNEPTCKNIWEDFSDKVFTSCTCNFEFTDIHYRDVLLRVLESVYVYQPIRSQQCSQLYLQRIEAKLGFLEYIKGPWREMCSTTPADFWGHHSAGPDTCADTVSLVCPL